MCRLRIPKRHHEALAIRRGWPISPSGYVGRSATSPRGRILQVREIPPRHAVALDRRHSGSRPCVRAAPAPTTSAKRHGGRPTAGDRSCRKILDTREYAREWQLPHPQRPFADGIARASFNVAFDGAGKIAVLGRHQRYRLFPAVEVKDGFWRRCPAVWFSPRGSAVSPGIRILPNIPTLSSGRPTPTRVSDAIVRVLHRHRRPAPTASRRG